MPKLKALRESKALSIRDLAKQAGVSPSTLNRIEHGFPARHISKRKLSAALKVEPSDIEW